MPRIPGFPGEYLGELDMARTQLLALADAAPTQLYEWSPAPGTRPFSAVLVHIAVANFCLLHLAGVRTATGIELYGEWEPDDPVQRLAMVRRNLATERAIVDKPGTIDFLRRSLEAVQLAWLDSSDAMLEQPRSFIGEETTRRRLYLRMLVHTHEHMGQAIAYARTFGMKLPWPDPLAGLENMPEQMPADPVPTA
ncbi:DinB family protein [Paludibaculum fermentans]|uniref:DinB family protein n=1 Tax=Paludibaculum fermentans TaxID=1473598 RepID=UPI003EC01998